LWQKRRGKNEEDIEQKKRAKEIQKGYKRAIRNGEEEGHVEAR